MNISINPSNIINHSKVVIRPMVPGELWVLNIHSGIIYSGITHNKLTNIDDDQGLYFRCRDILNNFSFLEYIKKFNVLYILFGCAKYQSEAPECSNNIYVYDLLTEHSPINTHLCNKSCELFSLYQPPYKVCNKKSLEFLFEKEDPILFQWGSKFPRPLIVREFDSEKSIYTISDKFLQWSPPRFWHELESVDKIPIHTEDWISELLLSFHWDYFKQAIHKHNVSVDQIAASIFEILYNDYIYFSISKRLWSKNRNQKFLFQKNELITGIEDQIVINYTDIINRIRNAINEFLLCKKNKKELIYQEKIPDLLDIESIIEEVI